MRNQTELFAVGSAMGRNRVIYAPADDAIVVSATLGSGGTWVGARQNLAAGWVPLFVRAGADASPGCRELLRRGGLPQAAPDLVGRELLEVLQERAPQPTTSESTPPLEDAERPPPDALAAEGATLQPPLL